MRNGSIPQGDVNFVYESLNAERVAPGLTRSILSAFLVVKHVKGGSGGGSYSFVLIFSFNTAQHARSPITFTQVAPISQSVLMLIYTPMTPAGSPAIVASAAKEAIAPPGTPGVPMESSTFAKSMIIIMEMLTLIPHAFAKNIIMKDIRIDTASILTVAPRGMAILVILLDTPKSSSMHCLLIGIVAELEQVPKAFRAAGIIALKNLSGLALPSILTASPYIIKANPKNAM